MESEPDYVTIMKHAEDHHKRLVAVMHYDTVEQGYVIRKCSRALPPTAAKHLADSWAAALGVEIR